MVLLPNGNKNREIFIFEKTDSIGRIVVVLRPKMPAYKDEEGPAVPDGLPPVTDAHVHISPRGILSAVRKWFDKNAWHIRYQLTSSQIFEYLLSRGIKHIVALQYAHKPGIARQLNTYMSEKCKEHENRDRKSTRLNSSHYS